MTANILGIDIGSYATKVVALEKIKGNRANLIGLGMAQLPVDVVLGWENDPEQVRGVVSNSLKSLVSAFKLSSYYVSTSLSGDSIVMKKITLPLMDATELSKSIHEEAEQYIPFSINEMNISYDILETMPAENQMSVMLVASRKNIIQNYMDALQEAKLKPAVIDIDGLALCNAYEFSNPGHKDNVVLVDIGANFINIIILHQGLPLVFKDEPGGGQYLNAELGELLSISDEKAEKIKFGTEPSPKPEETAATVDRIVSHWLSSVERAMDLARMETSGYKASRILLSGGSSLINGLPEEFEKYFSIKSELFNPLLNVQYNPKKYDPEYIKHIGPQMAVSFGLALRKIEV